MSLGAGIGAPSSGDATGEDLGAVDAMYMESRCTFGGGRSMEAEA
jgi:hypothetical protein